MLNQTFCDIETCDTLSELGMQIPTRTVKTVGNGGIIDERYYTDVPNLFQALTFLQDNYCINIYAQPYWYNDEIFWGYTIESFDGFIHKLEEKNVFNKERYDSHDEAFLTGIKASFKWIKKEI